MYETCSDLVVVCFGCWLFKKQYDCKWGISDIYATSCPNCGHFFGGNVSRPAYGQATDRPRFRDRWDSNGNPLYRAADDDGDGVIDGFLINPKAKSFYSDWGILEWVIYPLFALLMIGAGVVVAFSQSNSS